MDKIKIEITPFKLSLLENKTGCKMFIKIGLLHNTLSFECIYIDEYIKAYLIFNNGTNKEVIEWEKFKNNLLYFLQKCNEKFYTNSKEEANCILINSTPQNNGNLYFQSCRNKIMLINNNDYLNFDLIAENIDELYKIISFIENPDNFIHLPVLYK
jgi:hypothetical protein